MTNHESSESNDSIFPADCTAHNNPPDVSLYTFYPNTNDWASIDDAPTPWDVTLPRLFLFEAMIFSIFFGC